jgi:thiamine pyrophosphate-dependent acetolactate synthase large subunit-like protein
MTTRGADLVVGALAAAGVSHLFSLSGNQILLLYDATFDRGPAIVHTRHEAAAVHMADAWGGYGAAGCRAGHRGAGPPQRARARGCELRQSHYEKIAEALGGHGEFVRRPEDLAHALARAVASGTPACVNVVIEGVAAPTYRRDDLRRRLRRSRRARRQ